jgi:FAD/FMN-containing dehydrogenase
MELDFSNLAQRRSAARRIAAWGAATLLLAAVGCLARPAWHLTKAAQRDVDEREASPAPALDDASRLNATQVAQIVPIDAADPAGQLRTLLLRARLEGRRVSIGGARHSMGGHTLYPGGIALDMRPLHAMELDEARNVLHVGAGALWSEIVPYLDARGRSVAVMQSNNSFSVGGSISVNCHGWQFDRPPIASTVRSLRLMTADGDVVRCSRTENSQLFSLVLGGYGLFGVILDVDLDVVPNERYRLEQHLVPAQDALATFDSFVRGRNDVQMVYGRLNIVPQRLFDEVIINAFVADASGPPPALGEPHNVRLQRLIFCGSAESDYGKSLRWNAETKLQPFVMGHVFSRNQLINEGVEIFENRTADSTDVLHEYFVPREGATKFVAAAREIVLRTHANLLNVTVRSVNEDRDTFLRYANGPMFAFVMLYRQQKTADAERQMEAMTQQLIDAALASGGRYYLPYRLHATPAQFFAAYPQGREFFRLKRKYDPDERFQNAFYVKYGK